MFSIKPVDWAFVNSLITGSMPEGQELDYKKTLYAKTDKGRDELLKDVCALANASGGMILFGVEEVGYDKTPAASPITDESFDDAQLRIHQQLDKLIEPRLPTISFTRIDVGGGYIMALQIPGNFGGPYWFGTDGHKHFKVRRGARVSDFTYQELRAAFDRNASAGVRAREWIKERIDGIKAGRTWRPLVSGPISVVHFVPLVAYQQELGPIDPTQMQGPARKMPCPWFSAHNSEVNFDGLILYPNLGNQAQSENLFGYVQIFRDGSVESVMRIAPAQSSEKVIPPALLARSVHQAITSVPPVLGDIGREGPMVIGISLLETTGYGLIGQGFCDTTPHAADRSDLVVPAAYLEGPETEIARTRVSRSALDMIWQGFGYPHCPYFGDDGAWQAK
jgi:hypothetical protein